MNIREIQKDLFTLPHGWWFAHCISADAKMGAGIASEFSRRYDGMREYIRNWLKLHPEDRAVPYANVINLITKDKYWQKPTYETLLQALIQARSVLNLRRVHNLAMPRIGCGLDQLEWQHVEPLIRQAFDGLNIRILICTK